MRASYPTNYVVVAIVGLCVLLFTVDRIGVVPLLRDVTPYLYEWLILLGAVALLLGSINVLWFHWQRIVYGRDGWTYSIVLLVSFLAVLLGGLLSEAGTESIIIEWIFDAVIAPGQATLLSILAFFMAIAAYRYLRVSHPGGVWMLAGALLILIVQMPIGNRYLPVTFALAANWSLDIAGMAALRGVLLGSTIAFVLFGIRFLIRNR